MKSDLIGKVEKAHRYAQERHRVRFRSLEVTFYGDNDEHRVSLDGDRWRCTCRFFASWGLCSHTMARERMLEGMLPEAVASTAMSSTA